jgi:hypothetical protein
MNEAKFTGVMSDGKVRNAHFLFVLTHMIHLVPVYTWHTRTQRLALCDACRSLGEAARRLAQQANRSNTATTTMSRVSTVKELLSVARAQGADPLDVLLTYVCVRA